jgi:hypothetical protein
VKQNTLTSGAARRDGVIILKDEKSKTLVLV